MAVLVMTLLETLPFWESNGLINTTKQTGSPLCSGPFTVTTRVLEGPRERTSIESRNCHVDLVSVTPRPLSRNMIRSFKRPSPIDGEG